MIQAAGVMSNGQPLLIVGLSRSNVEYLLADAPIQMRTGLLGLPAMVIVWMGGETSQDIYAQLAEAGVMAAPPDVVRYSPDHIVQATGTFGTEPLLVVGLPREKCEGLLAGRRIELETRLMGLSDMRVVVLGGETEYAIRDHMIQTGLIDSETVQRYGVPQETDEPVPLRS